MNWRRVTKWILVLTAVVWAVYDFIPFFNPTRGDTISEVMLYYALRLFSLPFAFGVLCGHFFFPRDGVRPRPLPLVLGVLLVIGLDVLAYATESTVSTALQHLQTYPFIALVVGIPHGVLFWPQPKSDKLGGDEL